MLSSYTDTYNSKVKLVQLAFFKDYHTASTLSTNRLLRAAETTTYGCWFFRQWRSTSRILLETCRFYLSPLYISIVLADDRDFPTLSSTATTPLSVHCYNRWQQVECMIDLSPKLDMFNFDLYVEGDRFLSPENDWLVELNSMLVEGDCRLVAFRTRHTDIHLYVEF